MAQHPFERGQGLIDYVLIILLVVILVTGILLLLGPGIGSIFSNIHNAL